MTENIHELSNTDKIVLSVMDLLSVSGHKEIDHQALENYLAQKTQGLSLPGKLKFYKALLTEISNTDEILDDEVERQLQKGATPLSNSEVLGIEGEEERCTLDKIRVIIEKKLSSLSEQISRNKEPQQEEKCDKLTSEILQTLDIIRGKEAHIQEELVAKKVQEWRSAGVLHDIILLIDRRLGDYNADMSSYYSAEDMKGDPRARPLDQVEILGHEASDERNMLSRLKFLMLLISARDHGEML